MALLLALSPVAVKILSKAFVVLSRVGDFYFPSVFFLLTSVVGFFWPRQLESIGITTQIFGGKKNKKIETLLAVFWFGYFSNAVFKSL